MCDSTLNRSTADDRWYAVQCQPNRERAASLHLGNQDYEVFLPWQRKTRRHARRIETVLRPFFPGYLFVRLNLERDRWRSVNGTVGVVRVVMQGERPTPAPRGLVEALIVSCCDDGVLQWQPDLVPGVRVRVVEGPFVNLVGELEQVEDSGRVRLLLDIMGGKIPASLPRLSVVPAKSLV